MTLQVSDYEKALERAAAHARGWLGSLDTRPLPARVGADRLVAAVRR